MWVNFFFEFIIKVTYSFFSGEYPSRGSSRGRGSRGGRRVANSSSAASGFSNSDYLYWMNETGSRGSAYITSPSSAGATAAAAAAASAAAAAGGANGSGYLEASLSLAGGKTFEAYSQEEDLLYKERFPGKLCAFCNLSERSFLGQGDMVKFKKPESVSISELVAKKKKDCAAAAAAASSSNDVDSDDGSSSTTSGNPTDLLVERSPRSGSGLNARRKARKMTSGDLGASSAAEPVDELENVGFVEEPDSNLIFESSGMED